MQGQQQDGSRRILITGGAGFIGSNLAARLLEDPAAHVTVFDNLSRNGTKHNVVWLQGLQQSSRLFIKLGDVRDAAAVVEATRGATEIYHLAAQVAVTTSVHNPREDFETNAIGTFNVLEGARRSGLRPTVVYTSTNKVYGGLETVGVEADGTRYRAVDASFNGANELTPLDFHSPYGCSKGAADQYVRDYARIYDLPTVVFRMSCIAGPRQFGNEDQGWVAHFLYSVLSGRTINVYGNGLQVRDILHVDDLLDAMERVRERISVTAGRVYNVGGGMERAFSIREMIDRIERMTGRSCRTISSEVRPGDQPLYISNTENLKSDTGWQPARSIDATLTDIHRFWKSNSRLIGAQQQVRPIEQDGDVTSSHEELVAEEVV